MFRHLTALLLAILIANPLCCCFVQAGVAPEEKGRSCCAQSVPADEQAPLDLPCPGCQAKNPRVADGGTQLVVSVAFFELPTISAARVDLPDLSGNLLALPRDLFTPAPPPPRVRLALRQRYLI